MSLNETTAAQARTLAILRGLLAQPSGNEDDPFARVVLQPASGGRVDLTAEAPGDAGDDAIRGALRRALEEYRAQKGGAPARVAIGGLSARAVEREAQSDAAPLRGKIAVVTGAAGAIGAGICRGLLAKGCRVAATDLRQDALDALVAEFASEFAGRIVGFQMDVTDAPSVADAFTRTVNAWGGVDIVIVNAGIAMVAGLLEMEPEAFRRLERVNVDGTLLTLAEAGRWLRRQGTGGDIVLVSTKNVFAPGAQFGAYSATKAASHQLARIASLEFAPFGVRVNMVSPDAVFSDGARQSGLWAEVGPSRMKARGLDEKGLEEYYRGRNLLKARVTAQHVANAVLFFATRQTPTTGATIPVDGGLPDATPR